MKKNLKSTMQGLFLAPLVLFLMVAASHAAIDGITGTTFNFGVKTGIIKTPDGGSVHFWGYSNGNGVAQYPGPTLIVNEGDTITVTLTNNLTVTGDDPAPNVSILFPGQKVSVVPSDPGVAGLITSEAAVNGGTVTYSFVASNPGTYTYNSGTDPSLQIEMGLVGALIVRPTMGDKYAYNLADTAFDREYLFLLSEMDPRIHELVELEGPAALAGTDLISNPFPVVWFINGRNAPDTLDKPNLAALPHQPYNITPMMYPGQKVLLRFVGGSRDLHPFHHHGNHARVIARDGRVLKTAGSTTADLSHEVFTVTSIPGETLDAIFEWTGEGLNWDIYGDPNSAEFAHDCIDVLPAPGGDGFDDTSHEFCEDHGKPFPTVLPDNLDLAFGGFYSGSQFLGSSGALPPGEGGLNPYGGFPFMWHSHTEKELVNFDVFPGGMLTMMVIVPRSAPIPAE